MAPTTTTNFKAQETTARLLAALLATLDNPRIDYKKVAQYFGNNATESAMEHRFRHFKVQAEACKGLVERGQDPYKFDIPGCKTRDEMQKLFGASTADGLAFQFRGIKQGAKVLQDAVDAGNDPVEAFNNMPGGRGAAASVPSTPSARTPGSTKRARSTTKKAAPGTATPTSKRRKAIKVEEFEDEDSPEADYSELDRTPTKAPKETNPIRAAWAKPAPGTPRRQSKLMTAEIAQIAAAKAAAAAANGSTTTAAHSPAMGNNQAIPSFYDAMNPSYADPAQPNAAMQQQSYNQYPPAAAPQTMSMLMMDSASPSGASVSEATTPQTTASYPSATTTTTGTLGGNRAAPNGNTNGFSFKTEPETASFSTAPYTSFANDADDMFSSHHNSGGYNNNGYSNGQDDGWDEGDV